VFLLILFNEYFCVTLLIDLNFDKAIAVCFLRSSVADPRHFGTDPDPQIRMVPLKSDPDQDAAIPKKIFFFKSFLCFLLFEAT
jgi:hypothetical protein